MIQYGCADTAFANAACARPLTVGLNIFQLDAARSASGKRLSHVLAGLTSVRYY